MIPLPGWKDHLYSESPLPFVYSHDVRELRALLKCDDENGRSLLVIHYLCISNRVLVIMTRK